MWAGVTATIKTNSKFQLKLELYYNLVKKAKNIDKRYIVVATFRV